jgi:hypothetical protein
LAQAGSVKASCTLLGMDILDNWLTVSAYDSDSLWLET